MADEIDQGPSVGRAEIELEMGDIRGGMWLGGGRGQWLLVVAGGREIEIDVRHVEGLTVGGQSGIQRRLALAHHAEDALLHLVAHCLHRGK